MLVGIDVGGTYTDAVLIGEEGLCKAVKLSTDHNNLLASLLAVIDELIGCVSPEEIERVVLSTTLLTNLIVEGKHGKVGLLIIPGPGLNPDYYAFWEDMQVLKGAIDYRGREVQPVDLCEVKTATAKLVDLGYTNLGVIGKFSQRNAKHELLIRDFIKQNFPAVKKITLGHQVSGQINFPRRIATTYLTAATSLPYQQFVEAVLKAFKQRKILAPVYVLKADGGTLPINSTLQSPVETIFSGPAASTMGVMFLTPRDQTSIVMDIGGTTTDLSLILSGKPLVASKGIRIGNYKTHVRAFAVKSVGVGGDSAVIVRGNGLEVGPQRYGPAYCLGGPVPTPTDAMRVLGLTEIGDEAKAIEGIKRVGTELGLDVRETARLVLEHTSEKVVRALREMFNAWEEEPAYHIWRLKQRTKIRPQSVVGVGGAAKGLTELVATKIGCQPVIPLHAPVANAIGAAVAKPTATLTLHIDTEQGVFTIAEEGKQERLSWYRRLSEEEIIEFAREKLVQRSLRLGIENYAHQWEVVNFEVFNVVRGYYTTGRIYDVCVQIPSGVLEFNLGSAGDRG